MHTALYLRVSTTEQKLDSQLLELSGYCQRRDWQNVRSYTDHVSGGKASRPGLDALMADVRKQKVQRVVVYKLDRLGRSLPHLALLLDELERHGVALIAVSQGIDTSTDSPVGRLQMNVLSAVAQFEREIMRERVCAGIAAARQKGVRFGRPAKLQKHREEIAHLLAQGLGVRAIARKLKLPISSAAKLVKLVRQSGEAQHQP